MKFKLYPKVPNVNVYDVTIVKKDKKLIHELTIDKRITDIYDVELKSEHNGMPWLVSYINIETAMVEGKEALLVEAHCSGRETDNPFDCYYITAQWVKQIEAFCEKFKMNWFVYGKLGQGELTIGHFPMEIDNFLKRYISMKLGDEKNYLTWTVFHEILGKEYSIFKDK
jgi:hypothetical protein